MKNSFMWVVAMAGLSLIEAVILGIYDGLALLAWTWFMVPLGAPAYGYWELLGILIVGDIILGRGRSHIIYENQEMDVVKTYLARSIVRPGFILFLIIGVHLLFPVTS